MSPDEEIVPSDNLKFTQDVSLVHQPATPAVLFTKNAPFPLRLMSTIARPLLRYSVLLVAPAPQLILVRFSVPLF